ncbi:MAG: hypothetical protein QM500_15625 [Methylococcales bacterium]
MIENNDAIRVFNEMGGMIEQKMALKSEMTKQRLGSNDEIVEALKKCISSGVLIETDKGGLRKP